MLYFILDLWVSSLAVSNLVPVLSTAMCRGKLPATIARLMY